MHIPFLGNNTLQCRLKAAQAEVAAFRSGKKYQDMQAAHRKEVESLERAIRQLKEELARAHKDLKASTAHWMEVFEGLEKERLKREAALMRQMGQMEERAFRAERERDECRDKVTQQRRRIHEVETELEEEKGKNTRCRMQVPFLHCTGTTGDDLLIPGCQLRQGTVIHFCIGQALQQIFIDIQAMCLAISTIVYTVALALAPLGASLNSQFLRPTVNGRIEFSESYLHM